jgi:glycosyltransferase involved in cell wall biosynthesis
MKAAFIVPARNKEKFVGSCVRSILAQDYEPLEFSDQGSTDNTYSEMEKVCSEYRGRNEIRLLKCPVITEPGMTGLNAHITWLNSQTDADIIIQTSADDLDHQDRARETIEAYERHEPAALHTKQGFINPDFTKPGVSAIPLPSGFVTGKQDLDYMIGSSSSMSWNREFYDRVGGINGFVCPDIYLPYLATQDKGLYYLDKELHAYVRNNSPDNTGLEGVMRHFEGDQAKQLQIEELCHFQITNTLRELAIKCEITFPNWNLDDRGALLEMMVSRALSWAQCRSTMTANGIQPMGLRP